MAKEQGSLGPLEEFESRPSFHMAFPVTDLEAARNFYVDIMGCREGRSAERWADFNFFGFQITAHLVESAELAGANSVDEHDIPIPHFGLIMSWEDWHRAVDHLTYIGVEFSVEPHIRFKGKIGEQATFFVADPSGNCLEFKAFKNPGDVFAN
ncbi:MAG: VOC family protein [Gammaproteobacteria bacterium]